MICVPYILWGPDHLVGHAADNERSQSGSGASYSERPEGER